jgi:hypothetical protein
MEFFMVVLDFTVIGGADRDARSFLAEMLPAFPRGIKRKPPPSEKPRGGAAEEGGEGGTAAARQDGGGAVQRGQKWVPWRGSFAEFGFHGVEKWRI